MAPFVAAHLFICEKTKTQTSWDTLPDEYKDIRLDVVDVLYLSPFIVDKTTFKFKIGTVEDGTHSLQARLDAVIKWARTENPSIKIIAMQWYGNGIDDAGLQCLTSTAVPGGKAEDRNPLPAADVDAHITTYTDSVAEFLKQQYTVKYDGVPGHIDGWDVDYEWLTQVGETPKILEQLHTKIGQKQKELNSPAFQVSITPAGYDNLDGSDDKVSEHIQYVNMQNYSGGISFTADDYISNIPGLNQQQLVYGITSEEPVRNEMSVLKFPYHPEIDPTKYEFLIPQSKERFFNLVKDIQTNYAGVMLWRLNSDVTVFENLFQVWLYSKLNPTKPLKFKEVISDDTIFLGWIINGGRDSTGKLIADPSKWADGVRQRYGDVKI